MKLGKNQKIYKKIEKRQSYQVCNIKIHILAKFHEEIMVFEEIRGHLLILPFYRAQAKASQGPLRKKAIKFEVEVLDTSILHRICLI